MKVTLTIDGMTCGHCVKTVTETLSGMPGVRNLEVAVGRASFTADAAPDEGALRAALDEAGFELKGATRA